MQLAYRSLLFAPGHRPGMLEGSFETGADALVFDLEDGVPGDERPRDGRGRAF